MQEQPLLRSYWRCIQQAIRYNLSLFLLVCLITSTNGQDSKPIEGGKDLNLSLSKDGKIISPPAGFALEEKKDYPMEVSVEPPEAQHKKLLIYIGRQCLQAYYNLDDKDTTDITLIRIIYGQKKLDSLKQQLLFLSTILTGNSPRESLMEHPSTFSSFMGKDTLTKLLFDSPFTLQLGNKNKSGAVDVQLSIKDTIFQTTNENKIRVAVADMKKQFIRSYYLISKAAIDPILQKIPPRPFYENYIQDIGNLMDSLKNLFSKIKYSEKGPLICDDQTLQTYIFLVRKVNQQDWLHLLETNWILNWTWFTGGDVRLNPLPFTDDELLPLLKDSSLENHKKYDAYLDSVILLMLTSKELNNTKADYKLMDSLLREKESGKFGGMALYNAKLSINQAQAQAAQEIFSTINRTTLRGVDTDNITDYSLRSYDAANQLKGSASNPKETLPTNTKVEITIYNIAAAQDISFKENVETIEDRSAALADLNKALDITSQAFTNIGPQAAGFSQFVNNFQNPPSVSALEISATNIAPSPSDKIKMSQSNKFSPSISIIDNMVNYEIRMLEENNNIKLQLLFNNKIHKTANITAQTITYIRDSLHLGNCTFFNNDVLASLNAAVAGKVIPIEKGKTIPSKATNKFYLEKNSQAQRVQEIIDSILVKYKDRRTDTVEQIIANTIALLEKGMTVQKYPRYILPPAKFEMGTDTTPNYRNTFMQMADETTAKKKNIELQVLNSKSKEIIIRRNDSYKTAPQRRFTASVGVLYLFHPFTRSNATLTEGNINNIPDEDRLRLVAGIHYHLRKIILADDRFITQLNGNDLLSRFSIFGGFSFPKPLYNPHLGISADLWTGIKLNTGIHWYRYTEYKVLNNQIASEKSRYLYNGAYFGLSIEPTTIAKLIGLLNL